MSSVATYQAIIKSRDRNSSSASSSDCTISMNKSYRNVVAYKAKSLIFENGIYTFVSGKNNVIQVNEDGGGGAGLISATIPEGSYNTTDLATAMKTALDAAGNFTYTITTDTATNKMTISSTGSFILLFSQSTTPWYELGFSNADTASSTSHTSSGIIHIEGPNQLYFNIVTLNTNYTSSSAQSATFVFDNNVDPGNVLFSEVNSTYSQESYFKQAQPDLSQIVVKVTTERSIDQPSVDLNGGEWILVMEIQCLN